MHFIGILTSHTFWLMAWAVICLFGQQIADRGVVQKKCLKAVIFLFAVAFGKSFGAEITHEIKADSICFLYT